ncbi:MAG: hypothetical protein V3V78_02340 [Candidatus Woesearchaeota archaeon]
MDILKLIMKKAFWKYNNSNLHVQLSESGLHSDLYLNTDYIVADVLLLEEIIKNVFSKELQIRKIKPDWIVTHAPFGLAIAYALARETGAKFAYVDKKAEVCNFDIQKGEKVIVVCDDLYTGGSSKNVIEIMRKMGAKVESPLFTIGNFFKTKTLLDLEVVSVMSEKGNLYPKEDCPMCKAGSKAVLPRPNWKKLMKG